jgi:hypothetical protein
VLILHGMGGDRQGPRIRGTGEHDRWSPPWRARAFEEAGATIKTLGVGHRMGAEIGIDAVHGLSEATLRWFVKQE